MKEKEEQNTTLKEEVSDLKSQLKIVSEKLEFLKTKQSYLIGKTIHNLKNPVGVSSSFAEMMLEDLEFYTPEKLKKHLTVIKTSCDFSLGLLNNLQYISKLESGKAPLKLLKKKYCKLVKSTVKEQQILANKRGIKLHLTIDCTDCELTLDPDEIKQALHNLINNAHRYSVENSEVAIRVFATDTHILTTITDQGIGIETSELETIFDVFKVVTTFSDDGKKCLGLGLTIAKEIIEQHQGEITITSTLKKGSTFTIKIPRN